MNGFTLLIGSAVIFLIAYVVYGSWLAKQWGIDPTRKTPAETQKDGIDYLPTKPAVLLVQAVFLKPAHVVFLEARLLVQQTQL